MHSFFVVKNWGCSNPLHSVQFQDIPAWHFTSGYPWDTESENECLSRARGGCLCCGGHWWRGSWVQQLKLVKRGDGLAFLFVLFFLVITSYIWNMIYIYVYIHTYIYIYKLRYMGNLTSLHSTKQWFCKTAGISEVSDDCFFLFLLFDGELQHRQWDLSCSLFFRLLGTSFGWTIAEGQKVFRGERLLMEVWWNHGKF